MADIALRFHKDVLVLSAPIAAALARQGVNVERDLELVNLLEPESVHDALNLEMLAGAQCLVTNTEGIAPARLARHGMEGRASDLAEAALAGARELKPQHIVVEIGPCELPLDASSRASLNEHRDQYARAVREFERHGEFDAYLLGGFPDPTALKCALMGVRQATDRPVLASVRVDGGGMLANGRSTLEEAVSVMAEYGAQVAGFCTEAGVDEACALARRIADACVLPVLAELAVGEPNPRQGAPTLENPYYSPDAMVDAALRLRAAGVQFVRAAGNAVPAYTGALAATLSGLDVVLGDRAEAIAEQEDAAAAPGAGTTAPAASSAAPGAVPAASSALAAASAAAPAPAPGTEGEVR